MPKTLRLILGDQLNYEHSWFRELNPEVSYVMMEILPEAQYVRHHIQKLLAFFGAMRQFSDYMQSQGHHFIYFSLDAPHNRHSFAENIKSILDTDKYQRLQYQEPDEYRLDQLLGSLSEKLDIEVEMTSSEHFLSERTEVKDFFKGKKSFLLESFYRYMRKKYDVLMEGDQPLSGKWNYDADNRKKYKGEIPIPRLQMAPPPLQDILQAIEAQGIEYLGQVDLNQFDWPISREAALRFLDFFTQNCLPYFGTFQDAMEMNEPFLFHSRLSFAINTKILHPREVILKVLESWQQMPDKINLAQVEGFIRQVLGWREYMRGIYWAKMPEYADLNFLDLKNKLPEFYWNGNTKMRCLQQAISQSLEKAYAHHIQRLMVTGNFALLAGVDPAQVDEWYLGIYIDAIEWVEITNTRGMSQFADGGIVGTKPYVSSANYIDKMSNYCAKCHYQKKKRYGEKACPFNSLYWHFYEQHRDKLGKNPRIGMAYRNLDRMKPEEKEKIMIQAQEYLSNLDHL